jgi:hypothetical protein
MGKRAGSLAGFVGNFRSPKQAFFPFSVLDKTDEGSVETGEFCEFFL